MRPLQDMKDDRGIPLDRVGVSGLAAMVSYDTADGPETATADMDLSVTLPGEARGVHLSRFSRVLADTDVHVSPNGIRPLLEQLVAELGVTTAYVEISYDQPIAKTAPVSGLAATMTCAVRFSASLDTTESADAGRTPRLRCSLAVALPVMTVCPCSQEATDGIGHSQRTHVEMAVAYDGCFLASELVELAESCASAPVHPLLTGEDERAILESAVLRPVFVEDLVRSVAERLEADVRVRWYRVEAESLESVSAHNVYAAVERTIS